MKSHENSIKMIFELDPRRLHEKHLGWHLKKLQNQSICCQYLFILHFKFNKLLLPHHDTQWSLQGLFLFLFNASLFKFQIFLIIFNNFLNFNFLDMEYLIESDKHITCLEVVHKC